jgi:type IV pilus assembly protein PilO
MAMENILENIQNFDFDQLNDFNNVGNWPLAVKIIMWIMAFSGAVAMGYFLHITNLQQDLEKVVAAEAQLRKDYEDKAFQSAHLEDYRKQQTEMEESFGALLRQLPSDTEIPGLIEDITLVGLQNGLAFESINLQQEVAKEFYVEKPIQIVVSGSYHNLGSFVSDVADLSRIVTLHDFSIAPTGVDASNTVPGGILKMAITAKTYRYKDDGE